MSKYLLLRSNKQTGPFTLDEMQAMGLKAYDLVWIEGKSAAWRYPCEIDELKSFAPAVDEQPFDRFFKKPAVDNQTAAIHASSLPPDTEKKQSFPVVDTRAGNQSNTVYVNLPAAKKPVAEKPLAEGEVISAIEPVSHTEAVAAPAETPLPGEAQSSGAESAPPEESAPAEPVVTPPDATTEEAVESPS